MSSQAKRIRVGIKSDGTYSAWYWFAGTVIVLPGDFSTASDCHRHFAGLGYLIID